MPPKPTEQFQAISKLAASPDFDPTQMQGPDSHRARSMRFIAHCILKGMSQPEVVEQVVRRFQVSPLTATTRFKQLLKDTRLANDDEGTMDVIARELVANALKRARMFHKEAVAPVPEDIPLTPHALVQIARHRVEADKAARANAEFILNVFGRTSARWSPKQQVDVSPLQGGTDEQRAAVNRLLGLPDPPPIIDIAESQNADLPEP